MVRVGIGADWRVLQTLHIQEQTPTRPTPHSLLPQLHRTSPDEEDEAELLGQGRRPRHATPIHHRREVGLQLFLKVAIDLPGGQVQVQETEPLLSGPIVFPIEVVVHRHAVLERLLFPLRLQPEHNDLRGVRQQRGLNRVILLGRNDQRDTPMTALEKQLAQEVLVLSIERIGIRDQVVEQEQRTPLLLFTVRHNLPHDRLIPLVVEVRLWQPHRGPRVIQLEGFTEDENILAEQSLVPVLGQGQHVLEHV